VAHALEAVLHANQYRLPLNMVMRVCHYSFSILSINNAPRSNESSLAMTKRARALINPDALTVNFTGDIFYLLCSRMVLFFVTSL